MASNKKPSQRSSSATPHMAPAKSPASHLASFQVTSDQVQQLLDILKRTQGLSTSGTEAMLFGESEEKKRDEYQPKLRASKVDITSVYEFWNKSTYKDDVKKSFDADSEDHDGFIEFIAVFRRKFDSKHTLLDSFIDIKSTALRDSLHEVLDGVTCVSLREDKPSITREYDSLSIGE